MPQARLTCDLQLATDNWQLATGNTQRGTNKDISLVQTRFMPQAPKKMPHNCRRRVASRCVALRCFALPCVAFCCRLPCGGMLAKSTMLPMFQAALPFDFIFLSLSLSETLLSALQGPLIPIYQINYENYREYGRFLVEEKCKTCKTL